MRTRHVLATCLFTSFLRGHFHFEDAITATLAPFWYELSHFSGLSRACTCLSARASHLTPWPAGRPQEVPDYDHCRGLFRAAMSERGLADDGAWDWCGQLSRGRLSVGVVEARNLAGKKAGGLSDPYCTVALAAAAAAAGGGPRRAERTGCVRGDLNPVWDAQFELAVADPGARLAVYVWSRTGGLLPDRFLGRVLVDLSALPDKARPASAARSQGAGGGGARLGPRACVRACSCGMCCFRAAWICTVVLAGVGGLILMKRGTRSNDCFLLFSRRMDLHGRLSGAGGGVCGLRVGQGGGGARGVARES